MDPLITMHALYAGRILLDPHGNSYRLKQGQRTYLERQSPGSEWQEWIGSLSEFLEMQLNTPE